MMSHEILEAREERVNLQEALLKTHGKALLTHRVNTPGEKKDTPVAHGIFEALESELIKQLSGHIVVERMLVSAEGPVMLRIVNLPPAILKELAIAIEQEHPLGRFVDLDVYNPAGESLSRTALGFEARSCFVCSAPAHACARSQRHPLDELLAVMETGYLNSLNP